ncbi:hypothetical protein FLJC2902T_29590 [Flavobacterium limnosediminis JC2902]|uniref:Uncharacterized protein n=1 Tax=Flavobacterium limnosediminis JC2902 TaxID=1341181 RepID=V6SHL6_9FLAO|nr:hypothetical protein FLJC2902T_29590 [Flavobacterium limnosediminis JC2902]
MYLFVFLKNTRKCLVIDFGNQVSGKIRVIFNEIDVNKYHVKKNYRKTNNYIVTSNLRLEKGIQDLISALKDFGTFPMKKNCWKSK